MNFVKRAWFAVKRKPGRTILLLIIFFVIANLVLAGISIRLAVEKASIEARQQLGATLTLSYNMRSAMETAASSASSAGGKRGNFNITQEPLTQSMVEAAASQKNVLDYNIIVSTTALAENFSAIETSSSASSSSTSSNEYVMPGETGEGAGTSSSYTMPDVTITGVRSSELYSDFSTGEVTLESGSNITEGLAGQNVAIISDDLAQANGLSVGDAVQVAAADGTTTRTLTVIGIFSVSSTSTGTATQNFGRFSTSFSSKYNTIYTDYETALTLKSDASAADKSSMGSGAPEIDSAILYIDDPVNLSAAQTEIKSMSEIDWNSFSLTSDDATYENMIGAITKVGSFASIVVIVVSIIGAAILALILLLNVRERMFETGVLLAMGESRIKIILQYATEMLMIAIVAFAISFFSGSLVGQKLGDYLISSTISSETSSTAAVSGTQAQGGVTTDGAPNGRPEGNTQFNRLNEMRSSGGVNGTYRQISNIDVQVTPLDMLEVSLAGIAIILLATVVPFISIMRYKPRKILTRAG